MTASTNDQTRSRTAPTTPAATRRQALSAALTLVLATCAMTARADPPGHAVQNDPNKIDSMKNTPDQLWVPPDLLRQIKFKPGTAELIGSSAQAMRAIVNLQAADAQQRRVALSVSALEVRDPARRDQVATERASVLTAALVAAGMPAAKIRVRPLLAARPPSSSSN